MTRNQEIANTILAQLGGGRFLMITGSKQPVAVPNGLRVRLAKNKTRANLLTITLTADDLYDVEFKYFAVGAKITDVVVAKHEGIFCDQLQDIFEEVTGLYTTLRPRAA